MIEFLVYPIIIYLTAGAAVAALLALGVAQAGVTIHILGRETEPAYAHAALLVMACLFWPVVVWMLIVGRKRDRLAAQAAIDAREDEGRVARFAAQNLSNTVGVAAQLARD